MTTSAISISHANFLTAVEAGTLAPSMHNSQPWRFRLADGCLELRADPLRRLPVADPGGWAVRIACGAALCNARLALQAAHVETEVLLRPDPEQPQLLARLRPTGLRPPTPAESALHAAIPRRHSNRMPFLDEPVPADIRTRLRAEAQESGAWLELLVGRIPLAVVAEIVWAADGALRRAANYQGEQLAWTSRTGTEGIPVETAGLAPEPRDPLPMRDFGGPARVLDRDYEADPLVGVLGTAGDTAHDQLTAGIAMQRVLLAATDAGLSASLLSQAIEVPAARERLRIGLGRYGAPQIILRLGYGQPTLASPRRPAGDVIDA